MRAAGFLVAIVGLAVLVGGIVAGGQVLSRGSGIEEPIEFELDEIPLDATDVGDDTESRAPLLDHLAVASVAAGTAAEIMRAPEATAAPLPLIVAEAHALRTAPRAVAPGIVAPPDIDPTDLERIAPRDPLSDLGPAAPPRPKLAKAGDGPVMHRPVATESARFESKGRVVAIAGAESIGADETCDYQGTAWPCGANARTAFRSFLRGRSPSCDLPDDASGDEVIVATCRIGKQDIGAWLVANGWARATADGPYAEAGAAAAAGGKGIFGAPPRALPESSLRSGTATLSGTIVMPLDPTQTPDDGVPAEPLPWE